MTKGLLDQAWGLYQASIVSSFHIFVTNLYRFRQDVFKEGEVGGHCLFNKDLHKNQGKNKSPLQSW